MSRTSSGSATGGALGTSNRLQPDLGASFHGANGLLEVRRSEFRALVAVAVRALLPYCRTEQERRIVADAARGRMSANALEALFVIDARVPTHSPLLGAMEQARFNRVAARLTSCVYDLSEQEQQTNEPLNRAQFKAVRWRAASHWGHVAELCGPQIHVTTLLRDAAWAEARKGA